MKKFYTLIKGTCVLLFATLVLQTKNANAQDLLECGSDHDHQDDFLKKQIAKKIKGARVAALDPNLVVTLPVVFIVHHLGEAIGTGYNVSDANLMTALDNLNKAYSATSFYAGGVDAKIRFALVKSDKFCNPSTGIIRVNSSSVPGYSLPKGVEIDDYDMQDSLKALSTLFTNDDCLIIRTANIQSYSGFANFLGEAFIKHTYITSTYTVPHEIGHIFTLYHTFEGDSEVLPSTTPKTFNCPLNTNPSKDGDQVSDTAPHTREKNCSTANIATTANVCNNNIAYGASLQNLMSYSSSRCTDRFTAGQITRMRNNTYDYRPEWFNSEFLVDVTNPPTLTITPNPIIRGNNASLSTNCTGTTEWFSDNNVLLATQVTYSVNPVENTTYKVSCKTTNCTSPKATDIVNVTQPSLLANLNDAGNITFTSTGLTEKTITSTDNQRAISKIKLLTTGVSNVTITGNVTVDPNVDSTTSGRKYVQRHYDIIPSVLQSTLSADIILYYSQSEFNAYNLANIGYKDLPTSGTDTEGIGNIRIFQAHGTPITSDNSPENYTGTSEELIPKAIAWNSTAARWEITITVNGFSGFFVMTPQAGALPLTLSSFNAKNTGDGNLLTWSSTSESNFSHFEIQKGHNDLNWETIQKIEPLKSYESIKNYNFTDQFALSGTNYYRLKMISYDGSVQFSNTKTVNNYNDKSVTFKPNPTKDKLKIHFESNIGENVKITLHDMMGKIIYTENIKLSTKDFDHEISLNKFNASVYLLRIKDSKRMVVQKVIKQ